ncbi:hypothetical protein CVT26_009238 [Gymnopilus dilepis]|uniref:F-box domain-containing protein n=1 Tax=Gymnopilus dilepis TaxID=231916 RepID=A0A409YRM9_9AGAR|nr:hypothetical protein CVT26_009238 [Gymnopilus dilepis]
MPPLIHSLPPEILDSIFKEVHLLQSQELGLAKTRQGSSLSNSAERDDVNGSDSASSTRDSEDETNPDLTKLTSAVYEPSFFPYSLASVCSYWEEVLSAVPGFWTVLRVVLKHGFLEPINCQKYLSYSRDLPIDVFLIRDASQDDVTISQVAEQLAVPGCTKALVPHLHRCRTLYVDLTYSSSLPSLPRSLSSTTPLLQNIIFGTVFPVLPWDEDEHRHFFSNTLVDDAYYIPEGSGVEFKPPLRKLHIDGRNLRRAFTEGHSWIRDVEDLEEVKIGFYQPISISFKTQETEEPPYSNPRHECDDCALDANVVLEWLESTTSLLRLRFHAVNFKQLPWDTLPSKIYEFSGLEEITFSLMNAEDIQQVVRCSSFGDYLQEWQTMTFWSCSRLSEVQFQDFEVCNLQLLYLDDLDLARFLDQWQGQSLLINDCAGFSDALLEFLSTPYEDHSDGESVAEEDAGYMTYPCQNMCELSLFFPHSTSVTYSVSALRKLVEDRGRDIDYEEAGWFEGQEWGPALHTLRLGGKIPDFSEDDRAWFKKHLWEFVIGDEGIAYEGPVI